MSASSDTEVKKQSLLLTISKLSKNEIVGRDIFGRTVLHILILTNRLDLLKHLLRNSEVKKVLPLADYENGWNCLHYVFFYKRIACFTLLLEQLGNNNSLQSNTSFYELMRSKDRNKLTPIQLLGNDFKDLYWIPEYIDENNEYHLQHRFIVSEGQSLEGANKEPSARRTKKSESKWLPESRCGSDIYMYGSNINNNLGVGDASDRAIPSRLSHKFFRVNVNEQALIYEKLQKPRYRSVKLSKNHSLVLTKDGNLFSCGVGSKGRLGHGTKDLGNDFRFKLIEFFHYSGLGSQTCCQRKKVKEIAISNHHSIALTSDNEIYTWGLNNFFQLGPLVSCSASATLGGFKDQKEAFDATPREVLCGDLRRNTHFIRGIAASNVHSLAFAKNDIFFWGLNLGQMGFTTDVGKIHEFRLRATLYKGRIQETPKKISLREDIKFVETSETCTCVITTNNEIHMYFQHQHYKLPKIPAKGNLENNFDVFKPTRLTQMISIEKVALRNHQSIALLLDNGDVVGFNLSQDDFRNTKYNFVWKSYDSDMRAVDIDVSGDGSIILCTRNGSLFLKSNQPRLRKNSMVESSKSLVPLFKNKFRKIESMNKVTKVACDSDFLSFAFIRDEIDALPFKLQKNDFFKDIEYLSAINNAKCDRKQEMILQDPSANDNYVTDFLYTSIVRDKNSSQGSAYSRDIQGEEQHEDDEDEEKEEGHEEINDLKCSFDLLYRRHISRYDSLTHKRTTVRKTYQNSVSNGVASRIHNYYLDKEMEIILKSLTKGDRDYDFVIKILNIDVSVPFHKKIFEKRSPFFNKILNKSFSGRFDEGGLTGHVDLIEKVIIIENQIDIRSLLIFVYLVYTNTTLSIWDQYPTGSNCPSEIRVVKEGFESLLHLSQLGNSFGKLPNQRQFLKAFESILEENDGNVLVNLKDGLTTCYSPILIARSAFFETIFSTRWTTNIYTINFESFSRFQFNVILMHIYGKSNHDLFNMFSEILNSCDDFINHMLEFIEIADQLMLFDLKDLFQLAIKDLVTLNNVLILLLHANNMNAKKLFMNCCWFFYNNLEILLFDPMIKELPLDVLKSMERHMIFFQRCKSVDLWNSGHVTGLYEDKGWFKNNSTFLISSFLFNRIDFNELFISDKKGCNGFEPLVEAKYEEKKFDYKQKNRSNSRKSSSNGSDVDIFRKFAQSEIRKANESAIDESFEELEQDSKGESSIHNASSTIITPNESLSDKESFKINRIRTSPETPLLSKENQSALSNPQRKNSTPINAWNSKPETCYIEKQPILGKEVSANTKGSSKVKIGPTMRLSQKERKRLASSNYNYSCESTTSGNTWSIDGQYSSGSSEISVSEKSSIRKDESNQNLSKDHEPYSLNPKEETTNVLSLAEVMLQEALKVEEAKEIQRERQSLQDIQREQEFAKWWEEETAKVQKQMMPQEKGDLKKSNRQIKSKAPKRNRNKVINSLPRSSMSQNLKNEK
ncbi:uncharacterized protein PRCAT00001086001 [Priceomyces carsonii]|uniref:uncharacterized protein n=1 Tax=Priceomyces carsonii TaxID=28549 RepID=UPI002ED91592|nr:unnamed protein product [Priceomyces carsonii]